MQLEMIPCPKCGNDFPKLRKEKYGYYVCVNCSTVEAVVGITTVEGAGDHTYNDLIIMDQSRAMAIAKREAELSGKKIFLEILELDIDEFAVSRSVDERLDRILDVDLDDEDEVVDEEEETEGIRGIDY